ncbi:nucleolar protein 14 isoform X1 [Macrosteles quadrilineatus]|uniref:nucleolar protein 14 isoform X1 n=1 Tax=Macrosteles quadrilineatus TaxID=74068 RepID=UPI0023E19478|nr:nucleolar protein 14 isoform X1 [Macrosteles quadrilineatus]
MPPLEVLPNPPEEPAPPSSQPVVGIIYPPPEVRNSSLHRVNMNLPNKQRVLIRNNKRMSKKWNPFEVHTNRSKHHILGRMLKHDRGLPGISKSKALTKRKSTLLKEYQIGLKNNKFIDRRIGERNERMTDDDRIMARFAVVRERLFKKKAVFNLSDTEVLTHRGQTLNEIERFEDARSDDDEDQEGNNNNGTLEGKFVEGAHFGGGIFRKINQDRESLIDELIRESRKRRVERQQSKEDTMIATEELNKEWDSLGMIVNLAKDSESVIKTQRKDKYDVVLRQLKLEPHQQAVPNCKADKSFQNEENTLEIPQEESFKNPSELNEYVLYKSVDDLDDGLTNCTVNLIEDNGNASEIEYSLDNDCATDDLTELMQSVDNDLTISTICENSSSQLLVSARNVEEKYFINNEEELELPRDLNFPDNFGALRDLLKDTSVKQQSGIFKRLVQMGDKKKMLALASFIVELVSNGGISWKSLPVLASQFNILRGFNSEQCLKIVVDMIASKLEHVDADSPDYLKFLTWYILVSVGAQCPDVLALVSKPVLSLACRTVTQSCNISSGLLSSYLLLQDAKMSSKLYPEAILFLSCCVKRMGSKDRNSDVERNMKFEVEEECKLKLKFDGEKDKKDSLKVDANVLHLSVILLSEFVKVYQKYPESKLMFEQVQNSVNHLIANTFSLKLTNSIFELQTLLKSVSSAGLPSLVKNKKIPKALRQYEPHFNSVTIGKSWGGFSAEERQDKKLIHQYRKELKGAVRELRRDRAFLANVKLKEVACSDQERVRKVKEIMSSASEQQGELGRLKRKKISKF